MLKSQADYLIGIHPELTSQIQAGLILAIAGRVKPIGNPAAELPRNWDVLGETYEGTSCKVYTVRDLATTPRRWSCNCQQGQTYGPLTADFLGHPGRVCKHVASVGILWLECEYPEKPTSLYDLLSRLVSEQAIYLGAGEAIELPTPHKVKLEYYDQNGKSGLCLKTGRVRSEVLARWLPKIEVMSGGEWRLVGEARSRYDKFVEGLSAS